MTLATLALGALLPSPARAAPLRSGEPTLSLRLEGLVGQPTTRLGLRGGGGLGFGLRLTDQLSMTADAGQRAAPGGGIGSLAFGLQATIDSTPVTPYLEIAVVTLTNRRALGYSLATRTGAGADYALSRAVAVGVVVRTFTAFDPEGDNQALAGIEVALRLIFFPGAR